MTEDSKNSSHPGTWLASVVALLLAYPLSVGPVGWLAVHVISPGSSRPGWFYSLYLPLIWLDAHSPAFRSFIEWYGKLWNF